MENTPQPGIYEHYKSTVDDRKLYRLSTVAKHTETGEPLAIYVPLYIDPDYTGTQTQARPLNIFMSTVEVNGQQIQRFKFLGLEL